MRLLTANALLATLPALSWSLMVPNAGSPVFYLVSSSGEPDSNLLPLRMNAQRSGPTSLRGTGLPAMFYFYQDALIAYDPNDNAQPYNPLVDALQSGYGSCNNYGMLSLQQGTGPNSCASFNTFQIQSNNQDGQLGAQLAFNYTGAFYSCNYGQEVMFKLNPGDGPTGCEPVTFWTVPV